MSDTTEITQLVLHERQGRDRNWWDQMRSCFADEAVVRLSWFRGSGADFVTESQKMAGRGDTTGHRLTPPVVHLHRDRAVVETTAVIEMRTVIDDTETDLASTARLYYRLERRDGRWLILALDPVYERDSLTAVHPAVTLAVGPDDVAGYRASYRFLAYVLSRRGYTVADDLYGDDRPEETTRFYRETWAWLQA